VSLDPAQTQYAMEHARMVGEVHDAVVRGVGDEDTPGTAIFELTQLQTIAQSGLPLFGVLADEDADFAVGYDPADKYNIQIGAGEIGYKGQRIGVPPQKVSIKRTYGSSFTSSHRFHVAIGLPMAEARNASQVWSSVTSASSSAGSATLSIKDMSIATRLGFPLQAHVGGIFVVFSGLSADGQALLIDPSFDNGSSGPNKYGVLPSEVSRGTAVRFVYSPRVRAVYGVPVIDGSDAFDAFQYKVGIPTDWLPIAEAIVAHPEDPFVVSISENEYLVRGIVEAFPAPDDEDPLFDPADANRIIRACSSAKASIRQNVSSATVSDLVAALEDFTTQVASTPSQTFNGFWSEQPFRGTSYFARGVSFGGLERPEFTMSFARAYYAMRRSDVQHTFAIFRGDLYDSVTPLIGEAPATVQGAHRPMSEMVSPSNSTEIVRGSYVYGVTAVTNNGETAPRYTSITCDSAGNGPYFNSIGFSNVEDALYYNVYRRATLVGDCNEFLLTAPGEVAGFGIYEKPNLAYSSEQAVGDGLSFKFRATGTRLDSLRVVLRRSGAITNAEFVRISVQDDVSGEPSGNPIGTEVLVPFSSLGTAAKGFVARLLAELTDAADYHVVIETTAAPEGGAVLARTASTDQENVMTRSGSEWSSDSATGELDIYYGFVDLGASGRLLTRRGVRLTGRQSLTPRRLRIFVPPIQDVGRGFEPEFERVDAEEEYVGSPEDTRTRNEMIVTVTARLGDSGSPVTFVETVPQFSSRGWSKVLGTENQLFDRVSDVQVRPGSSANLRLGASNNVMWSLYDLVTVETAP
jgi:hypothetical protein